MKREGKIAIIIGTKAELIKCMPLMLELQKKKEDYWFIHTGQHSLKKVVEQFKIKKPDFVLSPVPKKTDTKFWSKVSKSSIIWVFRTTFRIKRVVGKINPRYVVYHGDTMSTAAAAVGSSKLLNSNKKWKNVHLEAGLRSGSVLEPFPEEISRKIADRFSDVLLAVSEMSEGNLKQGGFKGKVLNVGNTVIDSAKISQINAKKKFRKIRGDYVLVNLHRHENLVNRGRMENIVKIIGSISLPALWPMHDSTLHYLKKYGLLEKVEKINNLRVMPLTDYSEFIFLLSNCRYVVTDGGSIQEESLIFGKPCIILRKRTERQEGLETGINFLTNLDVFTSRKIINHLENGLLGKKKFNNPYGKPGVSKRIIKILK